MDMDYYSLGRDVESEFFTGHLNPGEAIPVHPPKFPPGSLVRSEPRYGMQNPTIYRVESVHPSSILHAGDWTIMCRGVETMEFTCGWEGYFVAATEKYVCVPTIEAPKSMGRLVRFLKWLLGLI